ncbi:hypothetical protein ACT7DN_30180 [Bacillus paranthracis]
MKNTKHFNSEDTEKVLPQSQLERYEEESENREKYKKGSSICYSSLV